MKVIVTQKQLEQIRESASKKFSCEKCDHSWKIEKEDKHPYLCHMCGYDSAKEKHNYDELENFWKNYKKEEEVTEKWSEKYKKSIDCSNPKGFSQKAHCQGRKKNLKEEFEKKQLFKELIERDVNEYASNYEWCDGIEISVRETTWLIEKQKPVYEYGIKFKDYSSVSYEEQENLFDDIMFVHTMYFPIEEDDIDCYMSVKGEFVPLEFKLYGYQLRTNDFGKRLDLYIDVDKDGDVYNTMSNYWHDLSNQLLDIFEMLGIRDERYMKPMYDFKFNKRPLYNITTV